MTENHKYLFKTIKIKTDELRKSGLKVKEIEIKIMNVLNKFRNEIDSDNVFNSIKEIEKIKLKNEND